MTENPSDRSLPQSNGQAVKKGTGCGYSLVQVLSVIWVVGNIIVFNLVTWSIEQLKFYTGQPQLDPRWGIVIFMGLLLFIPFLIGALIAKDARMKRQFLLWSIVSLFNLIFAPMRLFDLTQQQTILASQSGILFFGLVILLVVRGIIKDRAVQPRWSSGAIAYAVLFAGVIAIPWVLWGAWGSSLDVILGILTGSLAACCLVILLDLIVFRHQPDKVCSNALISICANAIMLSAIGQNGNQWALLGGSTLSGWIIAELYSMGQIDKTRVNIPAMMIAAASSMIYPMIFLDPDELQSVIASDAGELFYWVNLMIFFSLFLQILMGIFARLVNRFNLYKKVSRGSVRLSAVGIWLVVIALYFVVGQPGFHGERVFVILSEQPDLTTSMSIMDYDARRRSVYESLVSHADRSQSSLRSSLDRFGLDYTPYYLVNAIEINGGPLIRVWLNAQSEVDRVLDSPYLRPLPEPPPISEGELTALDGIPWNLKMINADDAWKLGFRGKDIVMGQSDSGVQGDHPEVADSYLGINGNNDYHWFDPWNYSESPVDIGGHGTHTLGTILGDQTGVAPDAGWIGCVNLARNLGNPAYYLDCMQFMLAPFPQDGDPFRDGKPELGAHILNNSWGCPTVEGCDPASLQPAAQALRVAGIFVVASAGNNGDNGCGTVEDPIAIYDEVFTVGAIEQNGNLTGFSSLGPVLVDDSGRIKPDIVAPGGNVPSSFPENTYAFLSGTSMAGPHVAGVVALMWSANPDLIGNIDLTETILRDTARVYDGIIPECLADGDQRNAHGAGVVDALQAVQKAMEYR